MFGIHLRVSIACTHKLKQILLKLTSSLIPRLVPGNEASSPPDDYHLSSIPPAATRRHDSTFDASKLCVCVCVYAWIIEHEELDWKHAFTG